MKNFTLLVTTLLLTFFGLTTALAQSPAFEMRRQAYVDSAAGSTDADAFAIQLYDSLPIDTNALIAAVNHLRTGVTSDFTIVKLIRVLYMSNGEYDHFILPLLDSIPFWLEPNDSTHSYWSENHTSMWNSSAWLLHEKYGWDKDSTLEPRLRHYLRMKVKYGFYEFFSGTYAPYCLSGLLNLADFAQDTEIKTLATKAAQRLLIEMLRCSTDQGVNFPAAGRAYYGNYDNPYSQNRFHLIWLLTGNGPMPSGVSHSGGFLATTSMSVDTIVNSYSTDENILYSIGHSIDTGLVANSVLNQRDFVLANWSGGGYFHPKMAATSIDLVVNYNLWHHVDFGGFSAFESIPPSIVPGIASSAYAISSSSVIMGEDVYLYKHNGVGLYSVQDFWKGYLGYQEFPLCATIGTTAVFTASGAITADWGNRPHNNANAHLPYIEQKNNKALIMYWPDPNLTSFGYNERDISLHWTSADFDQEVNDGNWLLGRQDDNYIAVYRYCIDVVNGIKACQDSTGNQTWAIIVGDSSQYGTFADFQNMIDQASISYSLLVDSANNQEIYSAQLIADGDTISYDWERDYDLTGIGDVALSDNQLIVFPNPATNDVIIQLEGIKQANLSVMNLVGQQVYGGQVSQENRTLLDVSQWPVGLYIIQLETPQGVLTRKLLVQ